MEYMLASGFLGTEAPFFMDVVTLIVTLLPLLVWIGILLVRRGYYRVHRVYQIVIFIVSVTVVGWFEYGARSGGGMKSFMEGNTLSESFVYMALIFHIIVAVLTMILWFRTLLHGYRHFAAKDLPGDLSSRHIVMGRWTALSIFLMSITGLWLYLLLFVVG